ncbi:GUN4 domain-containing protein [Synechococcus sp. CS-1332]|uniref:GUN4 domain-containing protein n=1 Tax=Synechococcus sp. CS-1332 TaxID=2847972 RepID=UPI00223C1641|nr:GUN4 domain-containing protein [Synechococcus sp. CS-1332]MCT0208088.1 GUN4 domain-containing protein [Synechococcus sp. CS-1332]
MLSGPPVSSTVDAEQLLGRFLAGSLRQRRSLLGQLEQAGTELLDLIPDRLDQLDATGDDWAAGHLIQLLMACGDAARQDALLARHPDGWLAVASIAGLDYAPLQHHLMRQAFEEADRLTSEHLRQLAGGAAVRRGYVYYSEVAAMSGTDLTSLDRLWCCYSQGRFGFSVQARLLQGCQGQWDRLWPRLGWKSEGTWTRYPGAFQWSLEAPEGHMPLVNQLRGVRLMDALLQHPAIQARLGEAPAGRAR